MPKDVVHHYNQRPQVGTEQRQQSPIVRLKNFNNFIKASLVGDYVSPDFVVLDLCCGKGGDLQKFAAQEVKRVVGVDVSPVAVEHATQRYKNPLGKNSFNFQADFYTLHCFERKLTEVIPAMPPVDAVCCQFALHYAFYSEESVRMLLHNASAYLKSGGFFFGTIPNANWLVKRLKQSDNFSFGNKIYNVRFEEKYHFKTFGHRYWFVLEDAIDDCPEYLVHFPTLTRLADEYGLNLYYNASFHDYYEEKMNGDLSSRQLFDRMRVVDQDGRFPVPDWEVAELYMVFAFRKR